VPIHVPPGVDLDLMLAPLTQVTRYRGEWVAAYRVDPEYRRTITRYDPVLFALVYLSRHLRSRETGGRTSLAGLHLALSNMLRTWQRTGPAGGTRHAAAAPRGAAKSTWALLIGPMWALAHGHRTFVHGWSDNSDQIQVHRATFRSEIAGNELLQLDYPDLLPARTRGRSDTARLYVARSGAAYAVAGIRSNSLGIKIEDRRPDTLVLDDVERDEVLYSPTARRKVLALIQNSILPMNEQAAVLLVGSTTGGYGSLMAAVADAGRGAEPEQWITDTGFRCRVFPALVTGPDGMPASFWPERYSLDYLRSISHTRDYALNFDLRPPMPGGRHWTAATFRYGRRPVVGPLALFIDPAPTASESSDYTAMAIGGLTDTGTAAILFCRAWHLTGTGIRERAAMLCRANPRIREVFVERNVGWARDVLEPVDPRTRARSPLAPGVRVRTYLARGHKGSAEQAGRITTLLDEYERGHVEHYERLSEYETQAQQWPETEGGHDDMLDVAEALVRYLLHPERAGIDQDPAA
jgi:hypothetical protein